MPYHGAANPQVSQARKSPTTAEDLAIQPDENLPLVRDLATSQVLQEIQPIVTGE